MLTMKFVPGPSPTIAQRRAYAENGHHPFTKTEFRRYRRMLQRQRGHEIPYDEAVAECYAQTIEDYA